MNYQIVEGDLQVKEEYIEERIPIILDEKLNDISYLVDGDFTNELLNDENVIDSYERLLFYVLRVPVDKIPFQVRELVKSFKNDLMKRAKKIAREEIIQEIADNEARKLS